MGSKSFDKYVKGRISLTKERMNLLKYSTISTQRKWKWKYSPISTEIKGKRKDESSKISPITKLGNANTHIEKEKKKKKRTGLVL